MFPILPLIINTIVMKNEIMKFYKICNLLSSNIFYFLFSQHSHISYLSIPVTIQPVVTHNNYVKDNSVCKCKKIFIHSYYPVFITFPHSPRNTLCCVNNMLNRIVSVGIGKCLTLIYVYYKCLFMYM